jgi:Family of unknown function (DUF6526)
MSDSSQTFANHARFVPPYHYVAGPILLINVLWSGWRIVQAPTADNAIALIVAIAIVIVAFFARFFALKVQDRVIRLEMRLRLATLVPQDLRSRINDLTPSQMVALRFASDAELPALVAAVIKDNIRDQTAIKKMIKNWTPDHARA